MTAKKASNKATNKSTVAGKRDADGGGEREVFNSSTEYTRRKRKRRKWGSGSLISSR
jgi:hypothetical protein